MILKWSYDCGFVKQAPEVLGVIKCKPWPILCTLQEAIEKFCPLDMDKPGSVWTEDMGVTDMYKLALKCPCSNVRCAEILLRLRSCERLKYKVQDALGFLNVDSH